MRGERFFCAVCNGAKTPGETRICKPCRMPVCRGCWGNHQAMHRRKAR